MPYAQDKGKKPNTGAKNAGKERVMFSNRTASKKQTLRKRLENIMTAVAFAEANQRDMALEMMTQQPEKRLHQRPQRREESRKDRRPVLMA
jgi:hypothetical protein